MITAHGTGYLRPKDEEDIIEFLKNKDWNRALILINGQINPENDGKTAINVHKDGTPYYLEQIGDNPFMITLSFV